MKVHLSENLKLNIANFETEISKPIKPEFKMLRKCAFHLMLESNATVLIQL